MQRRAFLQHVGLATCAALFAPQLVRAQASAQYNNLLVLVELKGGNDGLNTVIPYADPEYARLRPRIAIARDKVLQLDERTGLHPALAPLMSQWQAKQLAIVQGVGYPGPNLSHFRSIEIWDTASKSDETLDDGWVARAFETTPPPATFAADGVVINTNEPGPLEGVKPRVITLANTAQFLRQARLAAPEGQGRNTALEHILKVEQDIVQAATGLQSSTNFKTEFPKNGFGNAVKTACTAISSRGGIAAVKLSLTGFDTHINQPGTQERLLNDLAEGLVALRAALVEIGRWDSTLVMTYAEFGRRPRENQSNGTDHGTSNAHFVLGGKVQGGLYGAAPQLNRLDGNGNLQFAVDFRSLYATVLEKWWAMPSKPVLAQSFETVNFLRA